MHLFVRLKLSILRKPAGLSWLLPADLTRRNRWSRDLGNQAVSDAPSSATSIGMLMFYLIIKKADVRKAIVERRLWVSSGRSDRF